MTKSKFQEIINFALGPINEYLTKPRIRKNSYYLKHLRRGSIKKNAVLLESYHAVSLTGNVYAIFTKMVQEHPNFHFYWIFSDKNDQMIKMIREEWKGAKITFVKYESKKYYKCLAQCEYLINDTSFMPYFIKQKGQVYINTWHGTPLKTLGMDIKNAKRSAHKNIQRNLLQADKIIMPNKYTADRLVSSHDLNGILPAKIYVTGNPRVDLGFTTPNDIKKKYGLPNQKIILYAPTWKKSLKETTIKDINKILDEVNTLQKSVGDRYKIILKSHYFVYDFFVKNGYEDKIISNSIETNELLAAVDILITDYSSIFFDFLPLKRPVYFYIPDKDAYENSRGFYLKLEDLPGLVTTKLEPIIKKLNENQREYLTQYNDKLNKFLTEFCKFDDGHARERALKAIFNQKDEKTIELNYNSPKKKLLFYAGGFLNNGITNSIINLTNKIDLEKYEVIFMEFSKMNQSRLANLGRLNKHVHFVFRFSYMNRTLFDTFNQNMVFRQGFNSKNVNQKKFVNLNNWDLKRLIGNLRPDVLIDFGGYNKKYTALFGLSTLAKRKVIFLHNVMLNEYNKKIGGVYKHKWNLKAIFSFYDQFDRIISVSESANEKNKLDLMPWVKEPNKKMHFVDNVIDGEHIQNVLATVDDKDIVSAAKTYDHKVRIVYERTLNTAGVLEEKSFILPSKNNINFVNVARLSPEKNQVTLIRAFRKLITEFPNVKLHILGEGPSRKRIEDEIVKLNLTDSVFLYGFISDPITFVHYCDCFVLPSKYEGQGLSLIEAMIAKKPVIGTNVPGIKSVLKNGNGLLVENEVNEIYQGMKKYALGQLKPAKFDFDKYNDEAMHEFYERVVN